MSTTAPTTRMAAGPRAAKWDEAHVVNEMLDSPGAGPRMTGELRWRKLYVSPNRTERPIAVHGTAARTARRNEVRAPV